MAISMRLGVDEDEGGPRGLGAATDPGHRLRVVACDAGLP